jgi:hypothetical protein
MGKNGLNGYLDKINRLYSSQCNCDEGNQNVKHVLLDCLYLTDLRHEMQTALDRRVPMSTLDSLLEDSLARTEAAQSMVNTSSWDSL